MHKLRLVGVFLKAGCLLVLLTMLKLFGYDGPARDTDENGKNPYA